MAATRSLPLLLLPLLACSSGASNKDPVFEANFQNERHIQELGITKRQLADAEFMVKAASYQLQGQEISQVAARQAADPALRQLAQQAAALFGTHLQGLQAVARQKSLSLPTGLSQEQTEADGQLTSLRGAAFDARYREQLEDLLDKTTEAYDDMTDDAFDGDIRALAARQLAPLKELARTRDNLPEPATP